MIIREGKVVGRGKEFEIIGQMDEENNKINFI